MQKGVKHGTLDAASTYHQIHKTSVLGRTMERVSHKSKRNWLEILTEPLTHFLRQDHTHVAQANLKLITETRMALNFGSFCPISQILGLQAYTFTSDLSWIFLHVRKVQYQMSYSPNLLISRLYGKGSAFR